MPSAEIRSWQWAVGSGQLAVGKGEGKCRVLSAESRGKTVGGGQWAVGNLNQLVECGVVQNLPDSSLSLL